MRKVEVFLCLDGSLENLSAPYEKAVEEFHRLEPEILCLPWPETAIPPVGSKVFSSNMPFGLDECTVSRHEYYFDSDEEKAVRIEVYLEPREETSIPADKLLQYFAECGFVFYSFWNKPIKDILMEAGLYQLE